MKQFGMMSLFPAGPTKPGQSWTQESTLKLPMLGNQALKTTFCYEGTEVRDGRTLDKIGVTQSIKTADKKPAGEAKEPGKKVESNGSCSSEGKGFLYFDNTAGRLVEVKMDAKMKMDMNILGQKVTQDIDIKMHLSPPPAEASPTPAVKED